MASLDEKREQLLDLLRSYRRCAVAFSGGVDSAVVAQAAHLALGEAAVAVTGVSASLADGELAAARDLAAQIGIRHIELATNELADANYVANAPDRCFHCKTELYTQLADRTDELEVDFIANGANADDLGDYRPGMQAARDHHVRSPLAECGITKSEVRGLAAAWHLPVADKPAAPCLSSRIAYGQQVTPERLAMVDQAEQAVRALGLRDVRVRYHAGDLARIEVPATAIAQLADDEVRQQLAAALKGFGFKFVTLDLEGFRSGSLNNLIPVEVLTQNENREA